MVIIEVKEQIALVLDDCRLVRTIIVLTKVLVQDFALYVNGCKHEDVELVVAGVHYGEVSDVLLLYEVSTLAVPGLIATLSFT